MEFELQIGLEGIFIQPRIFGKNAGKAHHADVPNIAGNVGAAVGYIERYHGFVAGIGPKVFSPAFGVFGLEDFQQGLDGLVFIRFNGDKSAGKLEVIHVKVPGILVVGIGKNPHSDSFGYIVSKNGSDPRLPFFGWKGFINTGEDQGIGVFLQVLLEFFFIFGYINFMFLLDKLGNNFTLYKKRRMNEKDLFTQYCCIAVTHVLILPRKITLFKWPVLAAVLATLAALAASGCSGNPPGAQSEYVLGTYCHIDLFEDGSGELYSRLFARLSELDRLLSANRDDSELALVNRNAGLEPVPVSPELFAVLKRALYFAEASGGAFDPTVGSLVKLWGIGTESQRIPREEEIRAALDLVNWRDLELSPQSMASAGTAFLKRQGMALDLGAIAKGYAADELAAILRDAGVKRAIIDLGGNIYVWGNKADGGPWRIGVQDPLGERKKYAGVLELKGSISVVSSGTYERYFTGDDDKRYHHIMNVIEGESGGRRGFPVENNLLSATVISASSMDADALSTSCFALGYEKGLALAKANGAEALFIFADKTILGTPEALTVFSLAEDYKTQ